MATMEYLAKQMNVALQKFVKTLELEDSEAMEVADLYESWTSKLESKEDAVVGETLKYGVNDDGETQLYSVITTHTPQADWTPDVATSLFKKIGFTDDGTSIWTQPLGSTDAYQIGDVVFWNDITWTSTVDGNVWQPGVYGWDVVTE